MSVGTEDQTLAMAGTVAMPGSGRVQHEGSATWRTARRREAVAGCRRRVAGCGRLLCSAAPRGHSGAAPRGASGGEVK
eukprot:2918485-Prymnesium_polylepis.1